MFENDCLAGHRSPSEVQGMDGDVMASSAASIDVMGSSVAAESADS